MISAELGQEVKVRIVSLGTSMQVFVDDDPTPRIDRSLTVSDNTNMTRLFRGSSNLFGAGYLVRDLLVDRSSSIRIDMAFNGNLVNNGILSITPVGVEDTDYAFTNA